MTSPCPLSVYHPICSNCWKLKENPIFFITTKGEVHWACCERCKKELLGRKKINFEKSLERLSNLYLEVWKDTRHGKKVWKKERKFLLKTQTSRNTEGKK